MEVDMKSHVNNSKELKWSSWWKFTLETLEIHPNQIIIQWRCPSTWKAKWQNRWEETGAEGVKNAADVVSACHRLKKCLCINVQVNNCHRQLAWYRSTRSIISFMLEGDNIDTSVCNIYEKNKSHHFISYRKCQIWDWLLLAAISHHHTAVIVIVEV